MFDLKVFLFFLGKGVGGSIFIIFVDICDNIYDLVKILFDNYKIKKKIFLLRNNLLNYGLFFKG